MPEDISDQKEREFLNLKATFFLMVLQMARKIGIPNEELTRMFSPNVLKRSYNHIDATTRQQ